MDNGWIKLHRSLLDWEWYQDPNTRQLFFHILLRCNYKKAHWQGMEIMPGQLVVGTEKFGKEIGLSYQTTRTSLDKLKMTEVISTRATSKFLIITVTNWAKYQSSNEQTNEMLTSEQRATNEQLTTIKEGKKERKKENTISAQAREPQKRFIKPTLEEVRSYCLERANAVDPQKFIDHYQSNGWKVGRNPMKDWRAAVRTWEKSAKNFNQPRKGGVTIIS